ncbi:beta-N-acetylhexosaminidase [Bacteroides fluxus]|uniref:beta-N-acetylhexosaminidase n=1 Tax=Bacteroides fluxus TaxID=626930 RepID=UPI0023A812FF|nr:family 20 glycosylhydrolase [Bacteroides fluxus]
MRYSICILTILLLWPFPVVGIDTQNELAIRQIKTIQAPYDWRTTTEFWQEVMTPLIKQPLTLSTESTASIRLRQVKTLTNETYQMEITRKGVTIQAGTKEGASRALAHLAQLIAAADEQKIPCTYIKETPRFVYRGLMIDCSRHFWSINELKRDIRMMALFRFNRLHLHLTDNQGWRFYMKTHPEVALKGTHYEEVPELSDRYYSREELIDLVNYAAAAGIDIIPEIDLPGHCQALLTARPELSCHGGTFQVYPEEYEGVRTRPGENMICVSNPDTYVFINDIIDELTAIFPSKLIHLGGDEVATHIWERCPRCQALYAREKMTSWHELQDYFTQRVSQMVRSKGRLMIGWDEINDRQAASQKDVIMIWQTDGRKQQRMATERGLQMILSPKDPCYFDFGYSRNSTRRVYEWEPLDKTLNGCDIGYVLGGQANLWTEFVTTQEEVERMLWPRACALAEVLWYQPEQKSWECFKKKLASIKKLFGWTDTDFTEESHLDNLGFVPTEEAIPSLKEAADITTDIEGIRYYHKEYAFDGDETTFFATPYSVPAGSSFTVTLKDSKTVKYIQILFDASKEYPDMVELLISKRDGLFVPVPSSLKDGILTASFNQPQEVKAVKFTLPKSMMARLSIKEISFISY